MKPRAKPGPDPADGKQAEIVHLDDLAPREEIKGGARKLRFGETPVQDPSKEPER